MATIIVPSRLDVAGLYARRFAIQVSQTIMNPTDVPMWVDIRMALAHRNYGSRWTSIPLSEPNVAEVWALYHPAEGMLIDFALQRYTNQISISGPEYYLKYFGAFFLANFGYRDTAGYRGASTDFNPTPRVKCEMTNTPTLIPPKSKVVYKPTMIIPGPNASPQMKEFWSNYGEPTFDIFMDIYQLSWYSADPPPPRTGGEVIIKEDHKIWEAIRLKTEDRKFDLMSGEEQRRWMYEQQALSADEDLDYEEAYELEEEKGWWQTIKDLARNR